MPILFDKSLRVGGISQARKKCQQNIAVCVCKNNSRYKDKDRMIDVTFFPSNSLLHEEKSVLCYFSPVTCTPRKVAGFRFWRM